MAMSAPSKPLSGTMDIEEFMGFLEMRPKEERWHLIEGVAVMMAPPSLAHQRIAENLQVLLNQCFESQGLNLHAYHEIAVRLPGVSNFQPEPDVAVVPGVSGYDLYAERFQLIAEVLSPTNTRTELGLKLRRYREAPDNLYVLVIEPREFFLELHARARKWRPLVLKGPGDALELPELSFRCPLGDLYRGTPLDPARTA